MYDRDEPEPARTGLGGANFGAISGSCEKRAETLPLMGNIRSRIAEQMNCQASESLRGTATRKAQSTAMDSARYERLAEKLTPEIEQAIWCFREAVALGLIDIHSLFEKAASRY